MVIETELSKSDMLGLEEDYKRYAKINRLIAIRTLEITHPWKPGSNVRIGGKGSKITKEAEDIAIKKDVDKKLNRLYNLQRWGDTAYSKMDDDQKKMFDLKFKSFEHYSWSEVGEQLNISKSSIYRKRVSMFELLAKEEGLI